MMRYVVFAVAMGTLLCDAVSVPAQSSPCESGPHCRNHASVSHVDGLDFCCPEPNTALDVVSETLDGRAEYACWCSPVSPQEGRERAREDRRQAQQLQDQVFQHQQQVFRQQQQLLEEAQDALRQRDLR